MKEFPTLYKRNSNGSIQQWTIFVDGATYWAEYGQVKGKIQSDTPTTAEAKNVGRANETTPEEQALSEAESKWKKKIDRNGYWEDIYKIDTFVFTPMLAHNLKNHGHKLKGKEVMASPKLDGIRCRITKDNAKSRQNKQFVSTKYIEEAMKPFFELYPNAIVDGEIYNHAFRDNFNKIASLAKKTKNIDEETWAEIDELLEFHIFDFPTLDGEEGLQESYYDRYQQAYYTHLLNDPHIKFVEQKYFAEFDPEDELYVGQRSYWIEEGYEGVMVRDFNAPYEMKRSYTLLKSKDFIDEEFEIVDITEGTGNRSGMMGRMVLTDGVNTFEANARGNEELYTEYLNNKDSYIGKDATVRYQNKTPDGIPRFGVVLAVRDYE